MTEWQADPQAADAGLLVIGARFGAAAGLGLGRDAGGALDALAPPRRPCNPVRQVPIYATSLGASGTIQQPGTLGPAIRHYWSIRRLSAEGFTAGTVTFYDSSTVGEPLATFAGAAGVIAPQTFATGALLLHPQHYLVIVASGITGTVTILGSADLVPDWYLTDYLS